MTFDQKLHRGRGGIPLINLNVRIRKLFFTWASNLG